MHMESRAALPLLLAEAWRHDAAGGRGGADDDDAAASTDDASASASTAAAALAAGPQVRRQPKPPEGVRSHCHRRTGRGAVMSAHGAVSAPGLLGRASHMAVSEARGDGRPSSGYARRQSD